MSHSLESSTPDVKPFLNSPELEKILEAPHVQAIEQCRQNVMRSCNELLEQYWASEEELQRIEKLREWTLQELARKEKDLDKLYNFIQVERTHLEKVEDELAQLKLEQAATSALNPSVEVANLAKLEAAHKKNIGIAMGETATA